MKKKKDKKPKPTLYWVAIAHISTIAIIFILCTFQGCSQKLPPQTMQVNLASMSEPNDSPQANKPKEQPKPQPKKVEKPTPKPKKKTPTPKKQPVKKPTPVKKTWKALDASQIRKSTKYVESKPQRTVQRQTSTSSANEIASRLRKGVKDFKFKNTFDSSVSNVGYYDKVAAYLYQEWEQPNISITSRVPQVRVKIKVSSTGRVLSTSIVSRSGVSAMDASVQKLLRSLRSMPKPPSGTMTIDVTLQLTN